MTENQRYDRPAGAIRKSLTSWGVIVPRPMRWTQLTARQRGALAIRGVLQLGSLVVALQDLRNRPAQEVRGPKWLWAVVSCVNYLGLGPIAYFIFGRRATTSSSSDRLASGGTR
jgi:hypothetical protein